MWVTRTLNHLITNKVVSQCNHLAVGSDATENIHALGGRLGRGQLLLKESVVLNDPINSRKFLEYVIHFFSNTVKEDGSSPRESITIYSSYVVFKGVLAVFSWFERFKWHR